MMLLRFFWLLVILWWISAVSSHAQELPIFDAHIHYNQPDWNVFPPSQILAILDQAGIRRALVSSTPDDGTLKLYEAAPQLAKALASRGLNFTAFLN